MGPTERVLAVRPSAGANMRTVPFGFVVREDFWSDSDVGLGDLEDRLEEPRATASASATTAGRSPAAVFAARR